jgi:hypothetical protein
MPSRLAVRYEDDFYSWTREQAAALRRVAATRANLPEPVDLENVAEEIESLGVSQLRELSARYRVLLLHLLKWQYQPDKRTPIWRTTIRDQRHEIADLLQLSPGLKPKRAARLAQAYPRARDDAAEETGLPVEQFPVACPYTLGEIEAGEWWPIDA